MDLTEIAQNMQEIVELAVTKENRMASESEFKRTGSFVDEKTAYMMKHQVYVRGYSDRQMKDQAYGFTGLVMDIVHEAAESFTPDNCRCKDFDYQCDHELAFLDETAFMSGPETLDRALEILGGWSFDSITEGKKFFIENVLRYGRVAFNKLEQMERESE